MQIGSVNKISETSEFNHMPKISSSQPFIKKKSKKKTFPIFFFDEASVITLRGKPVKSVTRKENCKRMFFMTMGAKILSKIKNSNNSIMKRQIDQVE